MAITKDERLAALLAWNKGTKQFYSNIGTTQHNQEYYGLKDMLALIKAGLNRPSTTANGGRL